MAYIMGIDTGGTYTDSVVICSEDQKVLNKSKAFTTKKNLAAGIMNSINLLAGLEKTPIDMVCLSTTLATNAIVEGQGGRVGLILIGKDPGLSLPVEVKSVLTGRLDIKGREVIPLDTQQIRPAVEKMAGQVDVVAVSGYASVRNPRQEQIVKQIVRENLGLPVVCAHELSGSLGFEERTATVVFNARLIPVIEQLMKAVTEVLESKKIAAPIMVVKGDGSLMGKEYALERPIETILSGPAASVIGGAFLSKEKNALILDMGGTTTDTAVLEQGKVRLNNDGAVIGGFKTRVRAAEIFTVGIGGDSYIRINNSKQLVIGPERAQPLCVAAEFCPWLLEEITAAAKDVANDISNQQVPECFMALHTLKHQKQSADETAILNLLKDGPHSLYYIMKRVKNDQIRGTIDTMLKKGILMCIAMTPTDILHVTGSYCRWNQKISQLGLLLLAKSTGLAEENLIEKVVQLMSEKLMNVCRDSDAKQPVVAIGNPVEAWMPEVCNRLGRKLIIPEHAEVANAVGAAVGQVMYNAQVLIRYDRQSDQYIVYSPWERKVAVTLEEAKLYTKPLLTEFVQAVLKKAGAVNSQIVINEEEIYTQDMEQGPKQFVESRIKATGIGSPNWAEAKTAKQEVEG